MPNYPAKLLPFYFIIAVLFLPLPGFCAQGSGLTVLQEEAISYRERGLALQQEGKIEEAFSYYQKAIVLDPSYAPAYNDTGVILETLGQPAQAKQMYLKAIELEPDYPNSYSNLALLYEGQGKYSDAVGCWVKRIKLGDPLDSWVEIAKKQIRGISLLYPEACQQFLEPLEQQQEQLDIKIKKLRNQKAALDKQKQDLIRKEQGLQAKYPQLSEQITNLESQSLDLSIRKEDIRRQLQESQGQREFFEEQQKQLEDTLKELETQKFILDKQKEGLKELPKQIAGLEAQSLDFDKRREELMFRLQENQRQLSQVSEELLRVEDRGSQLNGEFGALEKEQEELNSVLSLFRPLRESRILPSEGQTAQPERDQKGQEPFGQVEPQIETETPRLSKKEEPLEEGLLEEKNEERKQLFEKKEGQALEEDTALQAQPDNKSRALGHLELARRSFYQGQYTAALKEATVAEYLDPSDTEISDLVNTIRNKLLE
ncbi:MAG: tetratricopeptide repeat protein [Candidatus Omnitrophica bacterium]|nr:tetratricopeptide repeat protein [Candidatus Omnitrophota bacterium]MDD5592365.1 tetratricopeptide repeat protein [Candidatus Omnitrophota bacterium]